MNLFEEFTIFISFIKQLLGINNTKKLDLFNQPSKSYLEKITPDEIFELKNQYCIQARERLNLYNKLLFIITNDSQSKCNRDIFSDTHGYILKKGSFVLVLSSSEEIKVFRHLAQGKINLCKLNKEYRYSDYYIPCNWYNELKVDETYNLLKEKQAQQEQEEIKKVKEANKKYYIKQLLNEDII